MRDWYQSQWRRRTSAQRCSPLPLAVDQGSCSGPPYPAGIAAHCQDFETEGKMIGAHGWSQLGGRLISIQVSSIGKKLLWWEATLRHEKSTSRTGALMVVFSCLSRIMDRCLHCGDYGEVTWPFSALQSVVEAPVGLREEKMAASVVLPCGADGGRCHDTLNPKSTGQVSWMFIRRSPAVMGTLGPHAATLVCIKIEIGKKKKCEIHQCLLDEECPFCCYINKPSLARSKEPFRP